MTFCGVITYSTLPYMSMITGALVDVLYTSKVYIIDSFGVVSEIRQTDRLYLLFWSDFSQFSSMENILCEDSYLSIE